METFKNLLNQIIDNLIANKGNQQADVSIAILSILNNMDANQWKAVFSPQTTEGKILGALIYQAGKAPPLLKAASIKMLGYMVYFDMSTLLQDNAEAFVSRVFQMVFEFASDSNLNVQIRNSWCLANLSYI